MKKSLIVFIVIFFFSSLQAFTQANRAAADDAERKMEEAGRRLNEAISGVAQTPAPVQTARGGRQPAWVDNPVSAYPRDKFITAVGSASNRSEAEKKAFAGIVAFFGQSIRSDFTVVNNYSEAITNGIISVSDNTSVRDVIVTAASMDSLIGAEIGSVWDDGRGTIYALAFLEKARTVAIYTEIIQMNQININNLTSMTTSQKNTFDGYARYKVAILLAGMNADYSNIVNLAGGSVTSLNLTSADSLSFEASNIIKNISVGFNVTGDQNNRIRDAFAKVLTGEGLRTQGSNTPYYLQISIDLSEAVFPGNNNKFCRYTINANLIERATGAVLLPFNFSDRASHATYEGAVNRAYIDIERAVEQRYPAVFKEYLAALMPK